MLSDAQREQFRQLVAMEDKYAQSWKALCFIDALETPALVALTNEPEFDQFPTSEQVFIRKNIEERLMLEPKTAALTDDWLKTYPNLAERMTDVPAKIVFVRATEFCNCDYDFLAKHIEASLAQLKTGVAEVKREIRIPWDSDEHDWNHRPRNRYCLTLSCVATYTQRAMNSFRHTFLRDIQTSRSVSREGTFICFKRRTAA